MAVNYFQAPFERSKMASESLKIFVVVVTYWFISISLVFANKYLVGNKNSYDVSIFVAWMQCMVTVLFILLLKAFKALLNNDRSFIKLKLKDTWSPQMMLLTCSYVGMLTFNNLCLRNVGIAFYQIARSLTLIFVVIFSLLILKKSVSWRVWLCCLTVAGGFVLGVDQEKLTGTLSVVGVVFGVTTSLFVSLNGIFIKRALDLVERDSVQLTLLNNINASILFIPFVVGTGQLHTVAAIEEFHTATFWGAIAVTGLLAFAIAWISALQIDLTSPVTHHISANSKAVVQTVIAVAWARDVKPFFWWVSVLLVIGGATSYALVRIKEESKATTAQHTPATVENGDVSPHTNVDHQIKPV